MTQHFSQLLLLRSKIQYVHNFRLDISISKTLQIYNYRILLACLGLNKIKFFLEVILSLLYLVKRLYLICKLNINMTIYFLYIWSHPGHKYCKAKIQNYGSLFWHYNTFLVCLHGEIIITVLFCGNTTYTFINLFGLSFGSVSHRKLCFDKSMWRSSVTLLQYSRTTGYT
jgi:hypothetical protein